MKIAIPIWEGRVSPVMDAASRLLVIGMKDGGEVSRKAEIIPRANTARLARFIGGLGVNVVLCGAISRQLESSLAGLGIRTVPYVKGNAEDIIIAYSNGDLNGGHFFLPASRFGRGCRRGGRRHGRRWSSESEMYLKEDS
jgi:predicted Fe-Mo cluster-binding NifX family protein